MAAVTLKSLHHYLKLLENASELKRRLSTSSHLRTLKEGLSDTSKLVGVDEAVFKDAQTIAALIGAQRFVMIWGEPSVISSFRRKSCIRSAARFSRSWLTLAPLA